MPIFPENDAVPNEVVSNIDVLRGIIMNQISWQSDDALTVIVDN